ncbi:hypothetical protein GOBAR_DD03558 [Gossypium barbadense]|nr:hypothetical protein GOBAR_DD03558 [Gossypium barbadense]
MAEATKSISPPYTAYQFEVTSPSALPLIFKNAVCFHILNSLLAYQFGMEDVDLAIKYLENLTKLLWLVSLPGYVVTCTDSSFSFSGNRSATRILKQKKLKINVHRPVGTRVVFDEEGNTQAPLAMLADKTSSDIPLDQDIEGVVEDSISSSWKSQGLTLLQVECYLMLHSMVVYLSRNLN